jgi:hypothetical protein|nr:MAG TPA: hypothetical protein [Caudoviricetes sp.]
MFKEDRFVGLEELRFEYLREKISNALMEFDGKPLKEWETLKLEKPILETMLIAVEKQIPEKPYKIDGWHCGVCKKRIYTTSIKPIYCSNCGQKLDWEGEDGQ